MSEEIRINRCQICGEELPQLETEGGFRFVCRVCGVHTERCLGFDEALRRWNELELTVGDVRSCAEQESGERAERESNNHGRDYFGAENHGRDCGDCDCEEQDFEDYDIEVYGFEAHAPEEYGCVNCANKRTPICDACSVIEYSDGSSGKPKYWVELGGFEVSTDIDGDSDIKERLSEIIKARLESGEAIPVAFVMLYNRVGHDE